MIQIILVLNSFILIYLILFGLGYLWLLLMSIHDIIFRYEEVRIGDVLSLMKSNAMPPLTVLISAYNEEKNILESVKSVLKSDYPNTYITIINDGSTDKTLQKLIDEYKLHKVAPVIPKLIPNTSEILGYYVSETHKNITVIDKVHRDKSDSLNIGINACRTPLLMTFDADSIIEPDAISELMFYMMIRPHAVAVGGSVYILNGCRGGR